MLYHSVSQFLQKLVQFERKLFKLSNKWWKSTPVVFVPSAAAVLSSDHGVEQVSLCIIEVTDKLSYFVFFFSKHTQIVDGFVCCNAVTLL